MSIALTDTDATPGEANAAAVAPRRWFGVGVSHSTGAAAGAAAARDAMRGTDPRLIIVFASEGHDEKELLTSVRSVTGDTPLIGCSTAGEISTAGAGDAGVVVTALGGEGFSIATTAATGIARRLRQAGAEVGACMQDIQGQQHRVLMLLTDGLAGDQQEIVRGAYAAVGADVPLVGGCAGDGLRMQRTRQYFNGEVLEDSIVAAAIGSDSPIGIGVRHGWDHVGDPMLVTSSAACRVLTLDDRPALDVYLERLEAPEVARVDPGEFTRFAMTHPLGLRRRSGEEVRFIAEADFTERALVCIAEVPQGGLAWLMEGDADSVLVATDDACDDALSQLSDRAALGLVAFDCIARRGVLGDTGIQTEVGRIRQRCGDVPVAGFYTYGEIARTRGIRGFHNQTLVVLALS